MLPALETIHARQGRDEFGKGDGAGAPAEG